MSLSHRVVLAAVLFGIGLAGSLCNLQAQAQKESGSTKAGSRSMNSIAESYVKLVLAVGEHDADYVDAYYGDEAWRERAKQEKKSLESIKREAGPLITELKRMDLSGEEEIIRLRAQYLLRQLESLIARVSMLQGTKFTFDEEAKALYDAEPPKYTDAHFEAILKKIEKVLPPGDGPLHEKVERFQQQFVIPKDKLDRVFTRAIEEARKRTKEHIALPAKESFVVEYVTNKPWNAYNWYKGNFHSVIQMNTDLPIYIDRAVDLACHEGYPGHHVYNVLLEEHMVKERGWVEFAVYPLFSSQSLIAEGSANFGIEVALPGNERINFEREVLFPLAGLDPTKVESYYAVQELLGELNYARNEVARRYLNGEIDKERAADWLARYGLVSLDRARKSITFVDRYRSYVINYNLGQDLVKKYIEGKGGTEGNAKKRWEEFSKLLSSPRLPSGLK
jgi:hypothetical protein